MSIFSNLLAKPSGKLILCAWGAAAVVAAYFSLLEGVHVVPLAWTIACLALPLLWASTRKALPTIAMAIMVALALFCLLALITIAADGSWNRHSTVAFALAGATLAASMLTLVASWRARTRGTSDRSAKVQGAENRFTGTATTSDVLTPSPKIFISYRRKDSQAMVDRMFERLTEAFGRENLFRDIDSIPKGQDLRPWIERSVTQCDVLLAVIGPLWLDITDEAGKRRLDDPADFVRMEIESALRRNIPVIPILLAQTQMPKADAMPESLRDLAYRNGSLVRHDPDFANDMRTLIKDTRAAGTHAAQA
jgi:hypothetical protein